MKQTPTRLDSYFSISKCGSTFRTEIMAGITTFITIASVLLLNPQIANGAFIGTCLSAFIGIPWVSPTCLPLT